MTLNLLFSQSKNDASQAIRVLLIGEYGGEPWQKMDVNLLGLDTALASFAPKVTLNLGGKTVTLNFAQLTDFTPEQFTQNNAHFLALKQAMRCLRQFAAGQVTQLDYTVLEGFVEWSADTQPSTEQLWLQYNRLREQLTQWIDQVLAYEPFQTLERNWLQLAHLLQALKQDQRRADRRQSHCNVTLLSATNEAMLEELDSVSHSNSSLLFEIIYSTELGQYGGEPYHAVSLQTPIRGTAPDLRLLTGLGNIASVAQCVVSATMSADFYHDITLTDEPLNQPRFVSWRHLVESIQSRYLMLSAGCYQFRLPYQYQTMDSGIGYEETADQSLLGALHIWHLYEFARAQLLSGTPLASAQCVDLTNLLNNDSKIPLVEVSLSPERRQIMADLGINAHVANEHFVGYSPRFQMSAARASLSGAATTDLLDQHTELLLLQNQFARHLKVSVRETLGHSSPEAVTGYIQQWLQPFVQSGGLVSRSQAQRQPLSKADLSWTKDERGGEVLSISLVANLPEYQQPVAFSLAWSGN